MFLSKVSVLFVAAFCLVSLSVSKANEAEEEKTFSGPPCVWTGPTCTSDCHGFPDGAHQWCHGCSVFVYCHDEEIHSYYHCRNGTVWDDNQKRCIQYSGTCFCHPEPETCRSTGGRCIHSCTGLKDGDYQSCHGCSIYASCTGGSLIDYRPCASNWPGEPLQWDDKVKRCLYKSSTCKCYDDNESVEDQLSWSQILKK